MAITTTDWTQTLLRRYILNSYTERYQLKDDTYFDFWSQPGQESWVFRRIGNRTAANSDDGSLLTGTNTTETKTTVTVDKPCKIDEQVPKHIINAQGSDIPARYGEAFGKFLARDVQNRKLAFISKTADERAGDAGIISFNDDDSDTDGSAIANAVEEVFSTLTAANADSADVNIFLYPKYFYRLRKVAQIASSDYTSGPDNARLGNSFPWLGGMIHQAVSIFNTDQSSNTDYPSKYRHDFQANTSYGPVWGAALVNKSFAVFQNEAPTGEIGWSIDYQAHRVVARTTFGMENLYPEGCLVLRGDTGSA